MWRHPRARVTFSRHGRAKDSRVLRYVAVAMIARKKQTLEIIIHYMNPMTYCSGEKEYVCIARPRPTNRGRVRKSIRQARTTSVASYKPKVSRVDPSGVFIASLAHVPTLCHRTRLRGADTWLYLVLRRCQALKEGILLEHPLPFVPCIIQLRLIIAQRAQRAVFRFAVFAHHRDARFIDGRHRASTTAVRK